MKLILIILIVLNILKKLIVILIMDYVDLMKIKLLLKEDNLLKVISILNKKVIIEINIPFIYWGIKLIQDNRLLLIGWSNDIRIYKNESYECIQIIKSAHDNTIIVFVELKDRRILSYSLDMTIKIWKI